MDADLTGRRFTRSEEWARRGERSDAWAATRGDILADDQFTRGYPRYVSRARGAYLWDVDGNRYVDYILGYGPAILGHAHPEVTAAVTRELALGSCMSPLWSPRQVELTELLTSVIPGAEMAYLMKTGSDATSAAVRLARIHTGRSKVVRWGYNGWHDWTAPRPAGVPESTLADTLKFRYNDIDSLRAVFAEHPESVACVIMMPFEVEPPEPGFLAAVRDLAHAHGALFVLDEMRSGFRMALGGAQEFFGVRPDLSTFSKAMANGFPISAVVGREDVMRGLSETHMSSTFYGNPAEMAAALTTVPILRDTDALATVWRLGEALQTGLAKLVAESGLPAEVVGYAPAPFLRFADGHEALKLSFYEETTRRGILLHPNHQWFLSAAHTDEDVEFTLDVIRESLGSGPVARELEAPDVR
ncbi:aspartate aminotransferase family protein [Streptomyces sp. NPDC058718]|uniref:aspartate aminotransferase family protein n=1 Tax=Streptomyces sp. NPDC058718 TaxID=3346610 RepID=UPI0036CAB21B